MFFEEYEALGKAAENKVNFLKKNPIGYFIASMLAGIYVGFGILLIFSIGSQLSGAPYTKLIMGISFGIALSLVIMAGAELFTGNNFVMTGGLVKKTVSMSDVIKLWIVCFLGNWVGSVLLAVIFNASKLTNEAFVQFSCATALTKTTLPLLPLFLRGVLCNMLVCLAVWCTFRCKSDSGKLIMTFWCLFAFITTGFEHSIANMTLLTSAILTNPEQTITLSGYFYNIIVVTLGNMFGGILGLALPYAIIANNKK